MKRMSRFIAVLLILCLAPALPAAAERENLSNMLYVKIAPGEVQMKEAGDITLGEEDSSSAVRVDNENGHGVISAGRLNRPIGLYTTGGSIIADYVDINIPVENGLAWITASSHGFVNLTGGDGCTTEGQGIYVELKEQSAARVCVGEIESVGTFGFFAKADDNSILKLKAKAIKNNGEYGLWIKYTARGTGEAFTVDVDELEGTNYALDLQQYGTGYSSTLRFGKVTAGNIGLKLDPERGTSTDILVEGDITSGRIGVRLFSDLIVKLIVLGTINAPAAPILVDDMSGYSGIGPNDKYQDILVWRIIPTASGHTVMLEGKESETVTETGVEIMEKAIRYIIRTEESDKAAFTLKKEDGEEIQMSFDYPVACEGERVLVEVQAADGYKVTGVMNGEEEKVPLEKDENGNWYFDMPRGGGISLFAVTEPVT